MNNITKRESAIDALTFRQQAAMRIMAGIAARRWDWDSSSGYSDYAVEAVQRADALIAELAKKTKK